MRSPLPVRNGVNATRLHLPLEGPWPTIMAYVLERFGHVNPEGMRSRFARGEVQALGGELITESTPLGAHEFLWYYRDLPTEAPIPFHEKILHRDEHLLVVDKPHFLPTTPGGMFVQESALVRLRRSLDAPELVPIHRLDRQTAGLLLFAVNPEARGAYQTLFERRQVHKTYRAVAAVRDELPLPTEVKSRMHKSRDYLLTREIDGEPNAHTRITLLQSWTAPAQDDEIPAPRRGLYELEPFTGKTHQLRVHMARLGIGILNDPFYPVLLDQAPDDYAKPLQLLAHTLEFRDPFTGTMTHWESTLNLKEAPTA